MRGAEVSVIIVAAGSGSRFGSELPKQFCPLNGLPVVMHSINRFRTYLDGARIILVLSPDRMYYWKELCAAHSFNSPEVTTGGRTRWESVKNALSLLDHRTKRVMVHDAARPIVRHHVVESLMNTLDKGAEGVLPVLPMTDSLRRIEPDGSSNAVDRSRYVAVQTPQAFPKQLLVEAYGQPYCGTMTDDASVMEAAGHFDIRMVKGDEATLKITRPMDLAIAEIFLKTK